MPVITHVARGAGLGIAVAVLVAGCGTQDATTKDGGLPAYRPSASPTAAGDIDGAGGGAVEPEVTDVPHVTPSSSLSKPTTAAQKYLERVSLTTADVTDLGLEVTPDQDAVSLEWPSVALCDEVGSPTEKHRVARYQVAVSGPAQEPESDQLAQSLARKDLTSAVTEYDSPAAAGQALKDWRANVLRAAECDESVAIADLIGLKLGKPTESSERSLPIADNSVAALPMIHKGKVVGHARWVLLRRGNLLAEVNYDVGNAYDAAGLNRLATILGNRILENPK